MFRNVYPREKYLKKIRPFYDSDIIKVITGIGKLRNVLKRGNIAHSEKYGTDIHDI